MNIRPARDKDYAAIACLHRQTIRNVNSKDYSKELIATWSIRSSAKKFRNSSDQCKRWVAEEDKKIIGFTDHSLEGEFWGLYVHKDYLGKGVGSKLLKTNEESLKAQGVNKVVIESSITAKEFYIKNGYSLVGKSFHLMENQKLPTFIMEKDI